MGVEAAHFMEEFGSDVFALEALAAHLGQPRPVPPVDRARPALEAEALVARAIWAATSRHPVSTGRLVEAVVMRNACVYVLVFNIILICVLIISRLGDVLLIFVFILI